MIKKNKINYKNSCYLLSAYNIYDLPNDNIMEIAITGRSNVGKSSIINSISYQKKLAKTSKNPGCTKTINIFKIQPKLRLIDFPGYGYAKIEKKMQYMWYKNLCNYIKNRKNLRGLIIVTDIRNPINKTDKQIIKLSTNNKIQTLILLNKADKINKNLHKKKILELKNIKIEKNEKIKIITSSNTNKNGINIIKTTIQKWTI